METESADSAKVLASIVLNQVPEDRRPDAYQAITSRLESSSAWPPDFAAAHLVAQLAQNDPEGGCSFNALCTFVKKIVESIPDSGDFPDMVSFREVAAFCYRYPQIMEKTISDINLDIERNVLGLEPPVGFAGHDEDDHAGLTLTSKYLALLRVFLLINPDCASRSSLSHLSSLFKLVRAPYKKVAYAARDVLYAWFDGNLESQPVKELNEMIWQHIVELITTMEAPLYQDIAFGIWLKWVDLRAWFCLAPAVISNDLYWTFLQSGLKDGSSERRKQCLYILMNTLPHIRESVRTEHFIYDIGERATLQILWAKYCTLFETIALERALNQIEDALPELHGLIESSLLIHGTWITTLLTVGLQPSMPDNIKKLLVSFLMSLRSSKELLFLEYFQDIVSGYILPYASHGRDFTPTKDLHDTDIICKHGNTLADFISVSLRSMDNASLKQSYTHSILSFVQVRGNALFEPARAYILQGLLQGLAGEGPLFGDSELDILSDICAKKHQTSLSYELTFRQCQPLCLLIDPKVVSFEQLIAKHPATYPEQERLISWRQIEGFARAFGPQCIQFAQSIVKDQQSCAILAPNQRSFLIHVLMSSTLAQAKLAEGLMEQLDPATPCFLKSFFGYDTEILMNTLKVARIRNALENHIDALILSLSNSVLDESWTSFVKILKSIPSDSGTEVLAILEKMGLAAYRNLILTLSGSKEERQHIDAVSLKRQSILLTIAACYADAVPRNDTMPWYLKDWDHRRRQFWISMMEIPIDSKEQITSRDRSLAACLCLQRCLIRDNPDLLRVPNELTLLSFTTLIFESRQSLRKEGLLSAIQSAWYIYEHVEIDDRSSEAIESIIETIWETTEILRYPREALFEIPAVAFHPQVLETALRNDRLPALLTNILNCLSKMSVGKAQIFAPLANAIRRAFMSSPSHLVHALPFEDFVVAFASDPPGMKYEVLLVESLALKFEGVRHRILPNGLNYQQSQGFGRACVFDMLNRIKGPSILTGRAIFDKLLTPWYTQKQPAPIVCKWKKTTQLQMMVILARQGVIDDVGEARREVFHRLLTVLSLESLPKYRSLLQWTILALIPEDATYDAQSLLSILESLDQSKPKYLASTIKIAVLIAKDAASDESYCSKLIKLVVFWTASSKVVVRYEAQRALLSIFAHAKERGWKSIIEDPILIAIDASYQMTKKETEHAHNIKFESFDSIRNPTLTDIFEGDYLLVEPAELPCVTRTDFVTVSQTDTTMERGLLDSHPSVLLGEERRRVIGDILEQTNAQKTSQLVHNMPLQIKSGSSRSPALSVRASNTFGADSHLRPHDFILIASLIENPYNIGGLSRVAEIFGAKSLCVRDLGVRKHVQFTSVAVSSHLWLPMEELPVGGVAEFLRQKRLDGYSIAGIEQTDVSKVLGKGDWKFPKKTVLLLGSERGGIPAPLLAEMDVCVEVKQAGVTRSMNVQTAAAIVLYEYARQHR